MQYGKENNELGVPLRLPQRTAFDVTRATVYFEASKILHLHESDLSETAIFKPRGENIARS